MHALVRPCPACGQVNRSSDTFCANCGGSLAAVEPVPRYRTGVASRPAGREATRPPSPLPVAEAGGGGGWVSVGIAVAVGAFLVRASPAVIQAAWGVGLVATVIGIWQMRRDRPLFHRAGAVTVALGLLTLTVVSANSLDRSDLPGPLAALVPPAEDIATTGAEVTPVPSEPAVQTGPRNDVRMAFGNPAHTGEHPGPGFAGAPQLAWQVDLVGEVFASPVLVDGVIFAGTRAGFLLAIDAATGRERWRFDLGTYVLRSSPAVVDGTVFVAGGYDLYALDSASGEVRWRRALRLAGPSSPVVVDGVLYLASQEGDVYAVDAETGSTVWDEAVGDLLFSSPAVAGGLVYIGSDGGDLLAFDVGTGRVRWRFPSGTAIHGSPVVAGGSVYITNRGGVLFALDARSGTERWRFAAGGGATPAVVDGVVYVAATETGLAALDAETGLPRWVYATGGPVTSAPTVAGDLVYAGSGPTLYAVGLDGVAAWRFPTRGAISASPIVAGGAVIVASQDGTLSSLRDASAPDD
ncbi:MAG: PQQ-binding-like beta-propeller repeat protein [Chloroflexota bacterium]|nr:PQQ-binding-like beta-propeller repeat protein [Chloroflexota bacterium]